MVLKYGNKIFGKCNLKFLKDVLIVLLLIDYCLILF